MNRRGFFGAFLQWIPAAGFITSQPKQENLVILESNPVCGVCGYHMRIDRQGPPVGGVPDPDKWTVECPNQHCKMYDQSQEFPTIRITNYKGL